MIRISQPWIEKTDGWIYLKSKISIEREDAERYVRYCNLPQNSNCIKYLDNNYVDTISGNNEIWFSVEQRYEEGFCDDRADAFVVSMLHYAMVSGADIYVDGCISSELLYNIRTEIIPHLCDDIKYRQIRIYADKSIDSMICPCNCAATGMSCGVDSMYSLWRHLQDDIPENNRIRYLTFFNVGAINAVFDSSISLNRRNELMYSISVEKAESAKQVAGELSDISLVFLNSNISDFYRGMLVNSAHYRNCGAAMSLQRLWNVYYYSSAGFRPEDIKYDLADDPAYHEDMLCPWLSNGSIRFYPAGHALNRVQKTLAISSFPIAQKYLTVCDNPDNCGKCHKCQRTISTLLSIGKLDEFKKRFNISNIYSKKWKWKCLIFLKKRDPYFEEIFETAKENGLFSMPESLVLYPLEWITHLIRKTKIYKHLRVSKYRKETQILR